MLCSALGSSLQDKTARPCSVSREGHGAVRGLEHEAEEMGWFHLEKRSSGDLIALNSSLEGGCGEAGVSLCSQVIAIG